MSNRFTRLLRLSLVATLIAAGAAAFSMREAPPASRAGPSRARS